VAKKRIGQEKPMTSLGSKQSALADGFTSIPALPRRLTEYEMGELVGRAIAEEFMRESRDPKRAGPPDA
jgi:hypothetical protein